MLSEYLRDILIWADKNVGTSAANTTNTLT